MENLGNFERVSSLGSGNDDCMREFSHRLFSVLILLSGSSAFRRRFSLCVLAADKYRWTSFSANPTARCGL